MYKQFLVNLLDGVLGEYVHGFASDKLKIQVQPAGIPSFTARLWPACTVIHASSSPLDSLPHLDMLDGVCAALGRQAGAYEHRTQRKRAYARLSSSSYTARRDDWASDAASSLAAAGLGANSAPAAPRALTNRLVGRP